MNSLIKILNELKENFSNCKKYDDFRSSYFLIKSHFNEFENQSQVSKNLLFPLKKFFHELDNLFISKLEPAEFNTKIFYKLDELNSITCFWNNVLKDTQYEYNHYNLYFAIYCYLVTLKNNIKNLADYSIQNYILNQEDYFGIDTNQMIHIIYCSFYSNKFILDKIPDSLLFELDLLLNKYWEIFYNVKPTNMSTTHYKITYYYKEILDFETKYLNRYKNIKKWFDDKFKHKNNEEEDDYEFN